MTTATTTRGASWLIEDVPADSIFTPEQISDEHRLIAGTAEEFVTNEVMPAIEQLEEKDWALARKLMKRAGELGLLGTDVPEELGGVGLDKVASIIVGEAGRPGVVVRVHVRRADGPGDHAAPLLRHRGAESQIPPGPRERRDDGRLLR